MFEVVNRRTRARTALQLLELVFHMTVRNMSGTSRNPMVALIANIGQTLAMVVGFYLLFRTVGRFAGAPIHGDFVLFLLSGIFLFMTHIKTLSKIATVPAPGTGMMVHAPMTTLVMIASSALAALYMQFITMIALLTAYHLSTGRVQIDDPFGAVAAFVLAWLSGVCFGLLFYSFNQSVPRLASPIRMFYMRINMVFSGKMSPANMLPASALPMFTWNPLFHIIDACRGAVFKNYTSRHSDLQYVLLVCTIALVIGLLGEFYLRQSMRVARRG